MSARILPFRLTPWRSLRLSPCINAQLAEVDRELSFARWHGLEQSVRELEAERVELERAREGLADG